MFLLFNIINSFFVSFRMNNMNKQLRNMNKQLSEYLNTPSLEVSFSTRPFLDHETSISAQEWPSLKRKSLSFSSSEEKFMKKTNKHIF